MLNKKSIKNWKIYFTNVIMRIIRNFKQFCIYVKNLKSIINNKSNTNLKFSSMTRKLHLIATVFILFFALTLNAQIDTVKVHQLDEIVIKGRKILDKLSESMIDSNTIERFTYHQPYDIYSLARTGS